MIIARTVFPKVLITGDRFHVQKLYYDALDDMRIAYGGLRGIRKMRR